MIKFILIVGICVCGVYLGVIIHNYFLNRLKVFKDFEKFCKDISNEISFLKTDKFTLFRKQNLNNRNSEEFLNQYILNGKAALTILKTEENKVLNDFLNSIGNSNVDGEIYNISYYEKLINNHTIELKEQYDKYGVLSIKLSIIICALLVIMLM